MARFSNSFLRSAQARDNQFHDLADTRRWLQDLRDNCACTVTRVPLEELENWYFDEVSGNLRHRSGRFFSIAGLRCNPRNGLATAWDQPIILQPEVGILGILTRVFAGTRYFLMQAKMEPGNANLVQLSPTLQATFSNYSQIHRGKLPPYTSYFLDPKARVINSQLQSETGTRFFRKFNRNVLLDLDEDVEVLPGFRWLTLYEIQRLVREDDTVNMDSRTVLSNICHDGPPCLAEGATAFARSATSPPEAASESLAGLRAWLGTMREKLAIDAAVISLNAVRDWTRNDWGIRHASGNYFEVAGVRVECGSREVMQWSQPLLRHEGIGLSGFLCADIGGVLHFLMQAKPEPGLVGSVEVAPTVSVFDYRRRAAQGLAAPYIEHFLDPSPGAVLYSAMQSEEGGRFWMLRNHVLVIQVPVANAIRRDDRFQWMTLAQLRRLSQSTAEEATGCVTSEARTLLACLPLFE
jgi:oxidase EvaA